MRLDQFDDVHFYHVSSAIYDNLHVDLPSLKILHLEFVRFENRSVLKKTSQCLSCSKRFAHLLYCLYER